jgi:UDP-glucose/GDP-mannose dehydrogenase family, NAD binding domain
MPSLLCFCESCYRRPFIVTCVNASKERGAKHFSMPIKRTLEYFKGAQVKVGVIGCGYVGLPLGLRFAEAGRAVVGFDTDYSKVEKLNRGQSYIRHIPGTKIQQYVNSKHFSATDDFTRLGEMDAVLICVPTPLDQRREPDLSYVEQTARAIQPNLQHGQLVVLESTTYPGTTAELVLPILEANGLRCRSRTVPKPNTSPRISAWHFLPSGKIPGISNSAWRKFPKSWTGSIRRAGALQRRFTRRSYPGSCP